ncbi:unnamed protein product [Moneuplotes crassus]|uniref:RING-type domain-containing protein n=1 Tax=Euplotes crassus TaxID=5936 RepID=A0AAD1XQZ3_EUPCR|nr:unnamed protein product [Moneuplotes crassus]
MSKHQPCSICYQNNTHWQHSCKSYVCSSCIQIWVITRITSDKLASMEPIPCLQQKCNESIFFSEMQECLSPEQMDKVYKAYNDNYISLSMDIVRCPNPGCSFAGVMPPNKCIDPFECPDCGYTWRDHGQLSNSELASRSFYGLFNYNPESFNYLNKLIYNKACPSCGMAIEKLEGCSHMMCQQCRYEFCWDCLGHFAGYMHEKGQICWLRKYLLRTLTLIPILLLIFHWLLSYSLPEPQIGV